MQQEHRENPFANFGLQCVQACPINVRPRRKVPPSVATRSVLLRSGRRLLQQGHRGDQHVLVDAQNILPRGEMAMCGGRAQPLQRQPPVGSGPQCPAHGDTAVHGRGKMRNGWQRSRDGIAPDIVRSGRLTRNTLRVGSIARSVIMCSSASPAGMVPPSRQYSGNPGHLTLIVT